MPTPAIYARIIRQGRIDGVTPTMAARGQRAALDWFSQKASEVRAVNANRLVRESPENRKFARGNAEDIGSMVMFWYDAKLKAKLPYWDQFPVCFRMSFDGTSALDLNLHYLPPVLRARLFHELYTLAEREGDRVKRLAMSYQILNNAARFADFRPCIKRHLFRQIRSRQVLVLPSEWAITCFLPLQRFVGATSEEVWRDSRRIIRNAR